MPTEVTGWRLAILNLSLHLPDFRIMETISSDNPDPLKADEMKNDMVAGRRCTHYGGRLQRRY